MKTPEEKRFERIKDVLLAESNGNAPVRIASTRTLFGIKSHAEEVIERTVKEMEEERKRGSWVDSLREKSESVKGIEVPEAERHSPRI